MGWSKTFEDIMDAITERQRDLEEKRQNTQSLMLATVTPTTIPVKISVSVQSAKATEQKDQTIKCCDCGARFLFTTGEQRFFASHQLHTPKRCKTCRQNNKRIAERRFWNGLL